MSEIRANTISDAAGTGPVTLTKQSAAKAWVNFNGTGTIAVRDSLNVSSLTDNGTGDYTVNFSNAFGAADYVVSASVETQNTIAYGFAGAQSGGRATTSVEINTPATDGTAVNRAHVNAAIHGDLA